MREYDYMIEPEEMFNYYQKGDGIGDGLTASGDFKMGGFIKSGKLDLDDSAPDKQINSGVELRKVPQDQDIIVEDLHERES